MSDTLATWEPMTADLVKALQASGGDPQRERVAIARALASYGLARAVSEPPFDDAVHFFAVDGVVLDFSVVPADEATAARWLSMLQMLPRRLDLLDGIAAEEPAV